MGMDAFKLFLIDTPGEKLFLLWIEIEKLKTCESVEKRKRFGYSSSRSSSYVPMILLSVASYQFLDYITIFFYLVATLLYSLALISSLYMSNLPISIFALNIHICIVVHSCFVLFLFQYHVLLVIMNASIVLGQDYRTIAATELCII